ncbi:hypothetical protein OEA41_009517 [Lepraria neglecta]|uniref:poly(A)-specific ribonuclease n=1 Tax=Lepraria neglecta TaxID=209136 RepID=A0AAD9Z262_9LECA|nr:hypothetical protein OEA41_009517 [Lepraria neglecta]
MPPASNRFGPTLASAPFSHLQQSNIPSHSSQHQSSNSGGLPPPSFNHSFGQGNPNNINPFAPTGNLNGLAGGFGPGGGLGTGGTGLASREAVMGFQHGAQLQLQQQARDQIRRGSGGVGATKGQMKSRIRDVWRGNLNQELRTLRDLVDRYPYISMDTEFPGIVARPMGAFTTKADYHYQTLRCNVDLLKVIQLGITLFNEDGEMPPAHPTDVNGNPIYQNNLLPCPSTWQFNFQFSLTEDMYNQESINFLNDAGLDLDAHEKNGIDPRTFGAALIASGMTFEDDVRWISFHSGYDFAYLVKLMLCKPLPEDEAEYRKFLSLYFPSIYDIKYMIKHAQRTQTVNDLPLSPAAVTTLNSLGTKGSLQDLADELGIKRIGVPHQAGSDSLLTGKVFWEAKKEIFNGTIDDDKYLGHVWGLNGMGASATAPLTGDPQSTTPNLNGATIYNNNPTNQGTPGTPASIHTGLASTPIQQAQNNGSGMGSLTPGGGGGVFGGFRFGKS